MKEINELLHKALEKKLEDGSFDEIISKYLNQSIENILSVMFRKSWNPKTDPHGEAYAYLETIIQPLVMKSLESCNLEAIAEKTKVAINALIENCSIAQLGNTLTKATGLFNGNPEIEWKKPYSMKKILAAYIEMIEKDTYHFDKDWFLDRDKDISEGVGYVECSMVIEEIEVRYGRTIDDKKIVTLSIDNEDEEEDKSIEFTIYKDYSGNWAVDYMQFKAFGFDELKKMNSVELLLRELSSKRAVLTDISDDSNCAEFRDLYE